MGKGSYSVYFFGSIEDVFEDVQQTKGTVTDIDKKVGATMNTVVTLGEHVIEQDKDISKLQTDVDVLEERVDDVEEDLGETKVKVEEIDNKVSLWLSYSLVFNPLLHRYSFYCINNKQILETLWEKKKLLVMSNFFFSHNVFYSIGKLYPHLSIFLTSYLYLLLNWKSLKWHIR